PPLTARRREGQKARQSLLTRRARRRASQRCKSALRSSSLAPSPPGDFDTPVLHLRHARVGGDRQLRLALGQNLEAIRRNAASEKTFQHRRRAALREIKIDFGAAGAIGGASQNHDDWLAFAI